MAPESEDPVVKEIDVYLTKELSQKLWLLQYPVRPSGHTYQDQTVLSTKIKPDQKKIKSALAGVIFSYKLVHIELSIDTTSTDYSTGKGEHIAMSVDGPIPKGPPTYPSGKLDKQVLVSSQGTPKCDRYAIGIVRGGEVHLTPLSTIVQIRPDLGYLDKADAASKQREKMLEMEAGDSSQDEAEEEVKAVTVKFSRPESQEEKNRRLASFSYLQRKQSEESWSHCTYQDVQSESSQLIRQKLFSSITDYCDAYCTPQEYLANLVPQQDAVEQDNPEMPSNVLSLAQLKHMPLPDRVKAIVKNAKVIRMSQLLTLLPSTVDHVAVVRSLQQVAVLVQGCWVIKSGILYPRDSFSAHSSTPAEIICKARDYVLWRFTQSRNAIRQNLSSIVKIPSDEMKEILEQIARPKVKQGWQFMFQFDHDFADKNKDVVQRQQMLWLAKYGQLAKHFKLPAEPPAPLESPEHRRRRRHSSRSKSRSDMSDSDVEKGLIMDVKKEFTFNIMPNGAPLQPFEEKLAAMLREKLLTENVLSVVDLRQSYLALQAMDSTNREQGDVIPESLLEKLVVCAGAVKVNPMGPPGSGGPHYILVRLTDEPDPIRNGLANLYQTTNKVKSASLKKSLEEQEMNVTDADMKRVLKDCCVSKGGYWYLKGTVDTHQAGITSSMST